MVAKKALRVNLSDLAAKGAKPIGFLLTLALPKSVPESWVELFARGLGSDAEQYECPLLGGDSVRTTGPIAISITALGSVPTNTMVRRSGARAGDAVMVTGTIGDAALGLELRDAVTAAKRWKLDNKYQLSADAPLSAAAAAQRAGGGDPAQRQRGDGRLRRAGGRPRQAVRRVRGFGRHRCRAGAAVGGGRERRRVGAGGDREGAHRRRRLRDRVHGAAGAARRISAPRRMPRACRSPRSAASRRRKRRRGSSAATASRCNSSRRPSVISERTHGGIPDGRQDGGDSGDGFGRAAGGLSRRRQAAHAISDHRLSARARPPSHSALRLRILATAAPAPTPASGATGRRSTRSSSCRATA